MRKPSESILFITSFVLTLSCFSRGSEELKMLREKTLASNEFSIKRVEIEGKGYVVQNSVGKDDPYFEDLRSWLLASEGQWEEYLFTLPAPDVMIDSDQLSLWIIPNAVILLFGERPFVTSIEGFPLPE
jgi:hypothetical protein